MDQSTMDKKVLPRGSAVPSKNGQEPPYKDYAIKKNGQAYGNRKRDDRVDAGRKPGPARGSRGSQRYVRPREKTGGQVMVEEGSLYHGRKKQNITHLMDWWGPRPCERTTDPYKQWTASSSKGGARQKWNSSTCHKYNKEHYLQANCQFIVMTGEDYTAYEHDPDTLVQWHLVEEVRLLVSETSNCPICLHPPIAAQVTRCGHIYCYPCILHYLALTDDNWRKCPICDEEVAKDDLKSVVCVVYEDYQLGEEVTLQLMRRDRDSLLAVPVVDYDHHEHSSVAKLSNYNVLSPYSKLFLATNTEVVEHIIAREESELQVLMLEEGDQPEACFTQEALKLLEERRNKVFSLTSHLSKLSLLDEVTTPCKQPEPLHLTPDSNANRGNYDATDGSEASVTAEDLDISQLQPSSNQLSQSNSKNTPKPTFFFYQAVNGSHLYLHALNVQMLVHQYGSLDNCPPIIHGKILEKESASMTEGLRNRLRYLRHLPVTCSFEVVEIKLNQPLISNSTIAEFQSKLDGRKRKRQKRAKEEKKIERRVKAEEDRIMGRTPGMKVSFRSTQHFPSFSDDAGSPNIPLEPDLDLSTSPAMSVESDSSVPSFAQMIREQPIIKEKKSNWCALGSGTATAPTWVTPTSRPSAVGGARTRTTTECSEEELEEMAAAPEYKQTFSDAFSKALDAAAKKAQEKQEGLTEGNYKGKKKKRQKGILLLSSGGF